MSAVLVAAGLGPARASAQTPASGLRASVAVTTAFDDNVMSSPEPKADLVLRVTPGIGFGVTRPRLTWSVDYSTDAERYQNRTELTTAQARQGLTFSSAFAATSRTSFAWTGTFASTTNPAELNLLTGLNVGRVRANQLQGASTMRHKMSEHTDLTLAYSYQRSSGKSIGQSQSHSVDMRLAFRPTEHSETFVRVDGHQFSFGSTSVVAPSTSTSVDGGWALHAKSTTFSIEGGAQIDRGHVGPRVVLSLARSVGAASLTGSYTRSITTAVGLATTVSFDSVAGSVTFRSRDAAPDRALQVRGRGAFSRNRILRQDLDVVQYGIDLIRPLNHKLGFVLSYDGSAQRGPALAPGLLTGDIVRNRVSVTLAFSPWSARR